MITKGKYGVKDVLNRPSSRSPVSMDSRPSWNGSSETTLAGRARDDSAASPASVEGDLEVPQSLAGDAFEPPLPNC